MRGKRPAAGCGWCREGLIPTYAGKTAVWRRRTGGTGAHPHVCGENSSSSEVRGGMTGSSPRMRGKRNGFPASAPWWGLIPTYAGKTDTPKWIRSGSWAHPHVCGENSPMMRICISGSGSSPRMRGKPISIVTAIAPVGLIPTYAGKTKSLAI